MQFFQHDLKKRIFQILTEKILKFLTYLFFFIDFLHRKIQTEKKFFWIQKRLFKSQAIELLIFRNHFRVENSEN